MRPQVSEDVKKFLSTYTPEIREIALKMRRVVLDLTPGVTEQIDLSAKLLAYGYAPTYKDTVCVIIPAKDHVNLGFLRGTQLRDPDGLLEGSGKVTRHVRLTSVRQAESTAVRDLILQSIELTKQAA